MRLLVLCGLISLAGTVAYGTSMQHRVPVNYSPTYSDGAKDLQQVQQLIADTKTITADLGTTFRSANAVVKQIPGFLGSLKQASTAILNVVHNFVPGTPSPEQKALQALQQFTTNGLSDVEARIDEVAEHMKSVLDLQSWKDQVETPLYVLRTTMEVYYNTSSALVSNFVAHDCQQYNPANILATVWSKLGRGCKMASGQLGWQMLKALGFERSELDVANCVPDSFIESQDFKTKPALNVYALVTNAVAELAFMMPTCAAVAWNGTAVADKALEKFNKLASQIAEYTEKSIPAVAERYWNEKIIKKLPDIAQLNRYKMKKMFSQFDNDYTDWGHGYVWWWTNFTVSDERVRGSGECDCCLANYNRSYMSSGPIDGYYFYLFRQPRNAACREQRAQSTVTWLKEHQIEKQFKDRWVLGHTKRDTVKWIADTVIEMSSGASFHVLLVIGNDDPNSFYNSVDWKPAGEGSGSFRFVASDHSRNNTYGLYFIQ